MIFFVFILLFAGISHAAQDDASHAKSVERAQTHTKFGRYKNISTAPSFLKFKIKDSPKNEEFIVIIENSQLAYVLAGIHSKGGMLGSPQASTPNNFTEFVNGEYLDFLLMNEGGNRAVAINEFPRNAAAGSKVTDDDLKKFLYANRFKNELSLHDLGVSSERELIKTCFDYNYEQDRGHLSDSCREYHLNPRVISLLIDVGYDVVKSDMPAPLMIISKIK